MQNILIIQTAFIGDVILATAVVEKLAQSYPEAQIDFLLKKGQESLLVNHPHIREIIPFDKANNKYKQLWHLLKGIRSKRYDAVINLHRFASTGLLTGFSGAREKIGFDKNPLSFLFTKKFPHQIDTSEHIIHEIERNQSLIAHLTDSTAVLPKLYPTDSDFQQTARERPYLCCAPASKWFTKQWPEAKWIELLVALKGQIDILLLGGKEDVELCERIKRAVTSRLREENPAIENWAGRLHFMASAALMSKAQLNIVNDSGPLHIASAMNAPVMAIFCSTVPAFGFGPLSKQAWVMEHASPLSCRPCGLHGKRACPEGHFRCAEIELNKIVQIIQSAILPSPF